jgi:prepilin signal peptidase PulO-like enzyme (type II secretory pathway)
VQVWHVWTGLFAALGGLLAGVVVDWAISRYVENGSTRRRVIVMLATAAVFAALGLRFGPSAVLPAYLYLGAISVALTPIDIALQRLPDPFTLPSYLVGIALLAAAIPVSDHGPEVLVIALIGMGVMWLIYFVQHFVAPNAMGRGDVKLAGVLGLYLGWLGLDAWLHGLLAGFILGGLFSLGAMLVGKKGRKSHIPYGPFMIIGALGSILFYAGA